MMSLQGPLHAQGCPLSYDPDVNPVSCTRPAAHGAAMRQHNALGRRRRAWRQLTPNPHPMQDDRQRTGP